MLDKQLADRYNDGIVKGLAEGEARGEIKRAHEIQKIAKQLFKQNMPPDVIAGITGFTIQQIEKLRIE